MGFAEIVDPIIKGSYSFAQIWDFILQFLADMWADVHIQNLWGEVWLFISYLGAAIPFVLLGIWLIVTFLGKRIFPVLRFCAFFIAGFALGVYLISPFVLTWIPGLPTWVIGVITGVAAAVLSKLIYLVLYAGVPAYATYLLFCGGIIVPLTGNYIVALLVALVVVVLMFIFRKYVETAGIALLGGYGVACVVRGMYDYTTWDVFVGKEWLGVLIFTIIVGAVGFFVQYKTRDRY